MFAMRIMALTAGFVIAFATSALAIEYGVPEPSPKFGPKGLFVKEGSDHRIRFRAYLESKQLLVLPDGIYYVGVERMEGKEIEPNGVLRWSYKARCAVHPDLLTTLKLGIFVSNAETPEQFTDVTGPNSMADAGWHSLWWFVCRNIKREFY